MLLVSFFLGLLSRFLLDFCLMLRWPLLGLRFRGRVRYSVASCCLADNEETEAPDKGSAWWYQVVEDC